MIRHRLQLPRSTRALVLALLTPLTLGAGTFALLSAGLAAALAVDPSTPTS